MFHFPTLYKWTVKDTKATKYAKILSSPEVFRPTELSLWNSLKYRVIHKSLRDFRPPRYSSWDGHAEGSISIGRESLQVFLCTRRRGVLGGFTARGQS
jgi:hypothetical protein